jgi:hypothetical protein
VLLEAGSKNDPESIINERSEARGIKQRSEVRG